MVSKQSLPDSSKEGDIYDIDLRLRDMLLPKWQLTPVLGRYTRCRNRSGP